MFNKDIVIKQIKKFVATKKPLFIGGLTMVLVSLTASVVLAYNRPTYKETATIEVTLPQIPTVATSIEVTPTQTKINNKSLNKVTPTPNNIISQPTLTQNQNVSNSNNQAQEQNQSNYTPIVGATIIPTSTRAPTPQSTTQPTIKPTATLTPIPSPTPTQPTSNISNINFNLNSNGANFTPNAKGSGSGTVTKNSNGYWDYAINVGFSNLMPNRNYQIWLCGTNCSSNYNSCRFITDNSGNYNLSQCQTTHAQWNDPIRRIAVWENPVDREAGSDPRACPMVSMDYTPCISTVFNF